MTSFMTPLFGEEVSLLTAVRSSLLLLVLYVIGLAIYAKTLHPLSDIPGPLYCAISRGPFWYANVTGGNTRFLCALHKKYGPVVRFSPNDVSFADGGQAWKDIFGYEKGRPENAKQPGFQAKPINGVESMLQADAADHSRLRRIFAPAFSTRALTQQEDLIAKYADLLITRLTREADHPHDMSLWYNCTTFDIMGDLALGQPLGLLDKGGDTGGALLVFSSLRVLPILQVIQYYPVLEKLYALFEPRKLRKMREGHFNHIGDMVDLRLEKGSSHPDILNLALKAADQDEESNKFTREDAHSNAVLFMAAGTETTASSLTFLTYLIITHPEKMDRLKNEIRNQFSKSDEMRFTSLAGSKYLNACIQESLRLFPPAPTGIPRLVAPGGRTVSGRHLPEGTAVLVHQMASTRSPENFRNPDSFVPERWLGEDPAYDNDRREAQQPFSYGPRNCLGLNLGWHEIRLVMAKMVYNFDLELCEESRGWAEGLNAYIVWERPPLMIKAIPVKA